MAIFHKHRFPQFWTPWRVPAEPVEIDATNPTAKGIYSLIVPGSPSGFSDISGRKRVLTSGNIASGASPFGPALDWSASTSSPVIYFSDQPAPVLFSLEALIQLTTTGTAETICGYQDGLQSSVYDRQIGVDTNGHAYLYVYTGTTTTITGTSTLVAGNVVHLAAGYDGTNYVLYVNGKLEASTAAGSAYSGYANALFSAGTLTYHPTNSSPPPHHKLLALILRHEAPDAGIIKSLALQPFSMLRPQARRSYGISAAGNAVFDGINLAAGGAFSFSGISLANDQIAIPAVASQSAAAAGTISTTVNVAGTPTLSPSSVTVATEIVVVTTSATIATSGVVTGSGSVAIPAMVSLIASAGGANYADSIAITTIASFPIPVATLLAKSGINVSGGVGTAIDGHVTVAGQVSFTGAAAQQSAYTETVFIHDGVSFGGTLSTSAFSTITADEAVSAFATAAIVFAVNGNSPGGQVISLKGNRSLTVNLTGSRMFTVNLAGRL